MNGTKIWCWCFLSCLYLVAQKYVLLKILLIKCHLFMLLVKVTDNDMSQCMHLPFSICSKTEEQGIKYIPV